jgi:serine/threonine protein kinase
MAESTLVTQVLTLPSVVNTEEPPRGVFASNFEPRRLRTVHKIGQGGFGSVYLTRDRTTDLEYAVKVEDEECLVPQLSYEARVYRRLQDVPGVPRIYGLWVDSGKRYLAMTALGPSLQSCLRQLTTFDVLQWVWPKALQIVEQIHKHDVLHRDLKPQNILTGRDGPRSRQLYLIDFGLSKRYRMPQMVHIPPREGKELTGTLRYASVHTHLGEEQGRRDDLESLGYVMLYLCKRTLPWVNVKGETPAARAARVLALKTETRLEDLCHGLPLCFLQYFRHVRSLRFEETPNYALLKNYICDTSYP